jgi:hypothetical protein
MKRVALLLAICAPLTACADRERVNCPRTKNQALTRTTLDTPTTISPLIEGNRCA